MTQELSEEIDDILADAYQKIDVLIAQSPENFNYISDWFSRRSLHIFETLVASGMNLQIYDHEGFGPLSSATFALHLPKVMKAIQMGASLNEISCYDNEISTGETPLDLAADACHCGLSSSDQYAAEVIWKYLKDKGSKYFSELQVESNDEK